MADRTEGGKVTPIGPGLLARISRGVRAFVREVSPGTWMSPGQPPAPVAPVGTQPRRLDYPVGYNFAYTPRAYEGVSFQTMRNLADGYDLLRLVIETRKDQVVRLPGEFRVTVKEDEPPDQHKARQASDPRIPALTEFFKRPDGEHSYQDWLRMILEDLFVIDAVSIFPRWRMDGGLYGLDILDGATIRRVLDGQGRTPRPPDTAYQQILHGVPAIDLMAAAPAIKGDQLLYLPRNIRAHKVYGYSPVEQLIMTVNIALRRQVHQLEYYTEGTIPDAFITVPSTWTPAQIGEFEAMWNAKFASTAERRKLFFLPPSEPQQGGGKITFTKDIKLKDEMDEWLARIVAFCFSIPPTALVKMMNRATAQQVTEDSKAEGLEPLQFYISQSIMNPIIQDYIGFRDIEHVFGEATRENPLQTAQINQIYVSTGVKLRTEVREELGLAPLSEEELAEVALLRKPPEAPPTAGASDNGQNGRPPGKAGKQPRRLAKPKQAALSAQKKSGSSSAPTLPAHRWSDPRSGWYQ